MSSLIQNLQITLIQSHLYWENPAANRAHFDSLLNKITQTTNLIVLPEMFTTGFTMNPAPYAEIPEGATFKWMQSWAIKKQAAITGSFIVKEKDTYFNRLFFVFPEGHYQTYDKKHTFTLAGEHKQYQAGVNKVLVDYKGWKLCVLICYDLRFPVWARNTEDYDVLLYVANWPNKRIKAWDTLLQARAIENMSYCVGVNRVGLDGNNHQYTGHSAVYDVLGHLCSTPDFEKAFVETISLSKSHLITTRKQLPFLEDKDDFNLI